jgi:hypothetical protein
VAAGSVASVGTVSPPAGAGLTHQEEAAERGEGEERRKMREMVLMCVPHLTQHSNMVFTSAKPPLKTGKWSKVNGFDS